MNITAKLIQLCENSKVLNCWENVYIHLHHETKHLIKEQTVYESNTLYVTQVDNTHAHNDVHTASWYHQQFLNTDARHTNATVTAQNNGSTYTINYTSEFSILYIHSISYLYTHVWIQGLYHIRLTYILNTGRHLWSYCHRMNDSSHMVLHVHMSNATKNATNTDKHVPKNIYFKKMFYVCKWYLRV
jgi:hypothetical protein